MLDVYLTVEYGVRRELSHWGRAVVVWLLVGFVAALILAYACTEFFVTQFDVRGRILMGGGGSVLVLIILANSLSFALLWICSMVFVEASGEGLRLEATGVCLCVQAIWLGEYVWYYRRNRPRLNSQN